MEGVLRMKKPFIISAFVLSAFLLFTGCFSSGAFKVNENIYNDDVAIASINDTCIMGSSSSTRIGNEFTLDYDSFNGTRTIFYLHSKGAGALEIEYAASMKKGQFKLVLVSPEGLVTTVFEGSDEGTKTIDLSDGNNRIKLVGYGASGKFQFTLKITDNVSVNTQWD